MCYALPMRGHCIRTLIHHGALGLAVIFLAGSARADVDVGRLVEGWRTRASGTEPGGDPFRALSRRTDGKLRVLVHDRTSNGSSSAPLPRPDMTLLRPGLLTWTAAPEEILSLSDAYPQLRVSWAAPRRLL